MAVGDDVDACDERTEVQHVNFRQKLAEVLVQEEAYRTNERVVGVLHFAPRHLGHDQAAGDFGSNDSERDDIKCGMELEEVRFALLEDAVRRYYHQRVWYAGR